MKTTYHITIIFVLAILQLCITSVAVGQSLPMLTDPIKIREIEVMATDLDLTLAQTESMLNTYDRYLEDFSRVRHGVVKTFEDSLTSMAEQFGFMNFNIPERDVVERLVSQGLRAVKSIQRVDKLFFEEVSGMLTENQGKILTRVQIARELEAYNIVVLEMVGQLNRGVRSNIRMIVNLYDVESTPEMEEMLDTYDRRYLKTAKRSFDAIVEMVNIILDIVDELGVRGLDQQALMMKFMNPESVEDLKSKGDTILIPIHEVAFEMSQLNWKTWNQLDALLSEEYSRKIQQRYFNKSYRDAVRGGTKIEKYFDRALALDNIHEGQRVSLEEAQKTFRSRWKTKTEKHASVLEKSRKHRTIDQMSGEQSSEFDEELDRLEEQRTEYVDATEAKIKGILGPEIVAQMQTKKSKNNQNSKLQALFTTSGEKVDLDSDNVVVIGSTSIDGEEIEIIDGVVFIDGQEIEGMEGYSQATTSSDGKVVTTQITVGDANQARGATQITKAKPLEGGIVMPDPIIPSLPRKAAEILGLENSQISIVEAVYDEYRDNYEVIEKAARGSGKALLNEKELSQGARLKKQVETNRTYAQQVADLDTIFFDDLATLTGLARENGRLLMLEDHRNRQRSTAPDNPFDWSGGDGNNIDLVDLYLLSNKSESLFSTVSPETTTVISEALQKYHSHVSGPHLQVVKASENLKRMENAMWLMEDSQNMDMSQKLRQRWVEAFALVRDAKRAYMLANQTFMESMLNALPENDYWNVRTEFVTQAYPDVFSKSKDATKMLLAAASIQSLDAMQQSQLSQLAEKYRDNYRDLCERMIQNHELSATAESGEGMFNQADIQREIQKETFRFERSELYDRVQMRLRLILNDDQIKKVPGLRPSADAPKKWSSQTLLVDVLT